MVFAGYSGFLHYLQMASHELAINWHKCDEITNSTISDHVPTCTQATPQSSLWAQFFRPSFYSTLLLFDATKYNLPERSANSRAVKAKIAHFLFKVQNLAEVYFHAYWSILDMDPSRWTLGPPIFGAFYQKTDMKRVKTVITALKYFPSGRISWIFSER